MLYRNSHISKTSRLSKTFELLLSRILQFSKKSKKSKVFNEITLPLMARLCKDFGYFGVFAKLESFAWFLMGELWTFRLFWKSHICYRETVTLPKHPCCPHNSPAPPHPYIDVLYIPSRRKSFLTFQIESHLNESPEVSR